MVADVVLGGEFLSLGDRVGCDDVEAAIFGSVGLRAEVEREEISGVVEFVHASILAESDRRSRGTVTFWINCG